MKKYIVILFIFTKLFILDVWTVSGAIAPNFSGGCGTKEAPYLISTAGDLMELSQRIMRGQRYLGREYRSAYYSQTVDIDMNSICDWVPIGCEEVQKEYTRTLDCVFNGFYNGEGHKILNIKYKLSDDIINYGLFGSVIGDGEISGVIKDVHIENVIFDNLHDMNIDKINFGGLVGTLFGGKIQRCSVKNTDITLLIKADNYFRVGGLIGTIDRGIIENCYSGADIYIHTINESLYAGNLGGTVGRLENGSLINCVNAGNISIMGPFGVVGGIIGAIEVKGSIYNCSNIGNINIHTCKNSAIIGGIAGVNKGRISHCVNEGRISGFSQIGIGHTAGLVGWMFDGVIASSINRGDVKFKANYHDKTEIKIYKGNSNMSKNEKKQCSLGGLIGEFRNGHLRDSLNTGLIEGQLEATEMTVPSACLFMGGMVGHIVPKINTDKIHIENILNVGKVCIDNLPDINCKVGALIGCVTYNVKKSNICIKKSYWNKDFSGSLAVGDGYRMIGEGEMDALYLSEMSSLKTFRGWDFDKTWNLSEGMLYPEPIIDPPVK